MVDNVEKALSEVCDTHQAQVAEYSVAPIYMEEGKNGGHEWIIEFVEDPMDIELFKLDLDTCLRRINSDYDAKRAHDFNLRKPVIHSVRPGTFYEWMKSRGKIGGQHKVPRLSNTRVHLDSLLEFAEKPQLA